MDPEILAATPVACSAAAAPAAATPPSSGPSAPRGAPAPVVAAVCAPAPGGAPAPAGVSLPVRVASTPRARLRGLLGHRAPPPFALRLDRCRCVHTVGMRFALDLHWLDGDGVVIRVDRGVGPWRVRACRRARAVVEVPVGASILRRP
ncbi:MAG TPA: DUF192 domain-containing protein [Baekduia sp.]